jgi:hypothetical protein
MYTIKMLMTFFSELTTQSKTAFNFGTRLMVFSGRSTRSTLNDLMVDKLLVISLPPLPLIEKEEEEAETVNQFVDAMHSKLDSRKIEANADDCTTHDHCVHEVPKFSQVTSRMEYHTQINDLEY